MGKWEQVLQSRKVWASVVAVGLLSVLFYFGAISGETYAWGVTIAVSVFTGRWRLRMGCRRCLWGWRRSLQPRMRTDDTNGEETGEETSRIRNGECSIVNGECCNCELSMGG